jgi:hypothetical protein
MNIFSRDLYRRFAIGFVLGTALVAAANADTLATEFDPPAQAAEMLRGHQPAPDFLIR